ncbi:hypothetical protein LWI28_028795 [Acer negundo]|uniref:Uncharacterized protein n=1 Tax=Acer negundo TaxID=4023 RepID=A0AAD5NPF0_ACENE|nr:hypothetical protein LWI28_028795 [Acer negundo]
MAQDYLGAEQSDDMELIGEKTFEGLVMRSFFQDVEKSEYDGIIRCKMHHIMHDFAQFLTKKECFTIESDGLKKPRLESKVKARHVMIRIKKEASFPTSIYNEIKLRSLLIDNGSGIGIELPKLFDQMTCLRSLDLSCNLLEQLPRNIEKLIHLRYLNLSSNSGLKQLPETLCYLYNLQTLNLSNCPLLKKMPEEIGRLSKLRHLLNYKTGTEQFIFMSQGIEKLTCLRTLNKIVIGGDIKACNFECLRNLNHLQGSLDIECRDQVDVGEINNAEFKNKENLYGLRLEFPTLKFKNNDFPTLLNEEAFEAFQPPPNLENLKIERYNGNPTLKWMENSLLKLKKLWLEDWKNLERLPSLGKLLSLETLSISKFSSIKRVHDEFLGTKSDHSSLSVNVFPKLKSLEFSNMYNWEEWDYGTRTRGEITIMPCLRYLAINYCNKLKKLPDYLPQLRMLEELKICSCPQLNKGTLEVLEPPPNLSKLEIESYSGSPMSLNRIASLTKLRKLTLQNCENLDYLPPLGKLSCLESLYIGNMRRVTQVHNEFFGIESDHGTSSVIAFPKLESLEFRDMQNWEKWDYRITQSGKEDVTIMPRLVSLTIWNCKKLKTVPDYLMKLKKLKKFDVEDYRIEGCYRWETVKDLIKNLNIPMDLVKNLTIPMKWINKNLIDLSIDFQYVDGKQGIEDFQPFSEIDAKGKQSLEAFQPPPHIDAEGVYFSKVTGIFTKIPDTFQPFPNIENLKIECYSGNPTILSWMESLKKLKELRLENCCCLPPLGKLSSLEKLHIKGASVEKVSKDFFAIESYSKLQSPEPREMKKWDASDSIALPESQYRKESVFPKLQSLEFTDMENWEEWEFESTGSVEEYIKIMPGLLSLRISNCPKLRTLPKNLLQLMTTLKKYSTSECPILDANYKKETLKDWFKNPDIAIKINSKDEFLDN